MRTERVDSWHSVLSPQSSVLRACEKIPLNTPAGRLRVPPAGASTGLARRYRGGPIRFAGACPPVLWRAPACGGRPQEKWRGCAAPRTGAGGGPRRALRSAGIFSQALSLRSAAVTGRRHFRLPRLRGTDHQRLGRRSQSLFSKPGGHGGQGPLAPDCGVRAWPNAVHLSSLCSGRRHPCRPRPRPRRCATPPSFWSATPQAGARRVAWVGPVLALRAGPGATGMVGSLSERHWGLAGCPLGG